MTWHVLHIGPAPYCISVVLSIFCQLCIVRVRIYASIVIAHVLEIVIHSHSKDILLEQQSVKCYSMSK
jgi:hypothetical protein